MKKNKPQSPLNQLLNEKKVKINSEIQNNFNISFQYLDTTQKYGSTFLHWQKVGLLSSALETLTGYCHRPLRQQVDGEKFTIYGNFPPFAHTLFVHPVHVPEDAEWARIHVNGPVVIVGHVLGNTFFIVFLDKTHKFWLTSRDRGKYFGKQYV